MTNALQNVNSLLPLEKAIENMLIACPKVTESEIINVFDGLNRVLKSDLTSSMDVPPHDNSAMDGYAFYCDTSLPEGTQFEVVGQSLAGNPFKGELSPNQCVKITTGATLPPPLNSVMMQENILEEKQGIVLQQGVKKGNSVRYKGEDIKSGQTVLAAGRKLTPADLALIASLGIAQIKVLRKLNVALIATGDELIEPGEPLVDGQIYESNRYALNGLLQQQNVDILHFGIVNDDPLAIEKEMKAASKKADVIITCGGVSVGAADYVKQVLKKIGNVDFWKVAIKPGKPFAFGKIGKAVFCGLPGNPVSSYVTFEKLVVPLLNNMQNIEKPIPYICSAKCAQTLYKRPGRADFQRGIAFQKDNGEWWVKPNGKQGSGIMTSIANANCYILLEQHQGNVTQGSEVKIELF